MAKTDFLTADMTRRQFMKISGKSLAGLTLSASMLSLFGCDDHRQQLVFLCDRGTLRRVTSTEEWNLWQKLIS